MTSDAKKIVSVTVAALLAAIAIYGSYLPLRKSRLYISGTRAAQGVNTLVQFEEAINPSLQADSPIGQNELVRNVGGMALTIVNSAGANKDLVDATVQYLNSYYQPILQYGKGPSFSQDLYIVGLVHQAAFVRTRDPRYLQVAQQLYEEGYRRGPRRPQFLQGLFDVYRIEGNVAGVTRIANEWLAYWPNDEKTKAAYEAFLKKAASSTPR